MLAALLKEKMQKEDLSARDAAKEIGTSHTTLLRAMDGKLVDLDTIVLLGKWLHVPPAELLNTFSASDTALSSQIASAIQARPKLADAFRQAMKAVDEGAVSPELIADIAAYAAFRISIAPRKRHT